MAYDLEKKIKEYSKKHGVPESLAKQLVQNESSGRAGVEGPVTRSGERAFGLTQVMPSTYKAMGYSEEDMKNPDNQLDAGLKYLAEMKARTGDWKSAVTAYHAGPGNFEKGKIGPNTKDYVGKFKFDEEGILEPSKNIAPIGTALVQDAFNSSGADEGAPTTIGESLKVEQPQGGFGSEGSFSRYFTNWFGGDKKEEPVAQDGSLAFTGSFSNGSPTDAKAGNPEGGKETDWSGIADALMSIQPKAKQAPAPVMHQNRGGFRGKKDMNPLLTKEYQQIYTAPIYSQLNKR